MAFPRGVYRTDVAAISACVMMMAAIFCGCGGGSSTSPAPQLASVAVTLSPSTATVQASQAMSFMATVSNDPKNNGTLWTLSGAGCTGAACGTLSGTTAASGTAVMYTAPAAVPNPPMVTLTATAVDDTTKSAKATITLTTTGGSSAISVVVAPTMASVAVGGTQTFAATLQNDTQNKGVNWTLSGTSCTGGACGTISPTSSTSGVSATYAAPSAIPNGTITLTATSAADPSKSAAAVITMTPPPPSVSVTPGTANLATGGVTQTFTANVTNDAQSLGVAWSLSGTNCSGAGCGSISPTTSASGAAVTYTSAARATAAGTVTVTATSVAEASAVGTAAVTLAAPQAPTASATQPFPTPVAVGNGYGIPAIATDASGNIDEAWINPDGVHFTRSTDGGVTFSAAILIPSDLSQNSMDNLLRMVVDALGNINLMWYRVLDSTDTTVGYYLSRSTDNGATFTPPAEFTQGPQPFSGSNVPTIVGRPDGKLIMTWIDASSNVLAEVTGDGIVFSLPTTIAPAVPGAAGEKAVVGPAGHVYVFWTTAPASPNCSISFSVSNDGLSYSAATTISGGAGVCNSQPAVSVDSAGDVSVTWVADATSLFFTRSVDGGATFATPINIATPANPSADEVIAGPDGGIYVLWMSANGVMFANSQDSGSSFILNPTPLGIPNLGGPPSFSVDTCGNVTVIGASAAIDTTYQRSNDGGVTFAAPVELSLSHTDFEQQLAADKFGNVNFTWAVDGPPQIDFARLPTVCSVQ
jgi:hypothetical protein